MVTKPQKGVLNIIKTNLNANDAFLRNLGSKLSRSDPFFSTSTNKYNLSSGISLFVSFCYVKFLFVPPFLDLEFDVLVVWSCTVFPRPGAPVPYDKVSLNTGSAFQCIVVVVAPVPAYMVECFLGVFICLTNLSISKLLSSSPKEVCGLIGKSLVFSEVIEQWGSRYRLFHGVVKYWGNTSRILNGVCLKKSAVVFQRSLRRF